MWIKKGKEKTIRDVFMRNIGVSSIEEVNEWFTKFYADSFNLLAKSLHGICPLREVVEYVVNHKDSHITIVGDYDADGVTSTTILKLALKWCGFKNVSYRIPKRFSEGFGINTSIIDEINDGLIITCDNGVAQIDAIELAKSKGIDVVIIDHHQPAVIDGVEVLPPADFIVDPNAINDSADFNGYCGAGLSLKFARELFSYIGLDNKLYNKLLGLAAIGTVADVMQLKEENYVIVKNGMKHLLRENLNPLGVNALIRACGCGKELSAHDIGFKIGPVINASSRMRDDGATAVVELLTMEADFISAISKAEKLLSVNEARKICKKEGLALAEETIMNECLYGEIPLVLNLPGVKEGIIGIIAGNLCEKYKIPTIVLTETEDGILKGSARSCGNCDIKAELDKVSEYLLRYGGHEGAAGLSLDSSNLADFKTAICNNLLDNFKNEEDTEDVEYDLEIDASKIAETLLLLKQYEPFGEGNPAIRFKISDFEVIPRNGSYKAYVGSPDNVKLFSSDTTAVGFGMGGKLLSIDKPKNVNLIGVLSENWFNGTATNQIEFSDITVNITEVIETPLASRLKALAMAK